MADELRDEVTRILSALRAGDAGARDRLVRLIYDELRRMAAGLMQREDAGHTLQPTALVNEALLRLDSGGALAKAPNRHYVFGAACRAMRQILVEHARRRETDKRGGGWQRVPLLDDMVDRVEAARLDALEVREALDRLATFDERQSQVVTLRFLFGFTAQEVANQLGVSLTTVNDDWHLARAWLYEQLREGR